MKYPCVFYNLAANNWIASNIIDAKYQLIGVVKMRLEVFRKKTML